jgi:hypothetical protein
LLQHLIPARAPPSPGSRPKNHGYRDAFRGPETDPGLGRLPSGDTLVVVTSSTGSPESLPERDILDERSQIAMYQHGRRSI